MGRSIGRHFLKTIAVFLLVAAMQGPFAASSIGASLQDTSASQCNVSSGKWIDVTNADELSAALKNAKSGDQIHLADGTYAGTFSIEQSGSADHRIVLCGTRKAIIDGGDVKNGYALHITADYWTIQGITITNALKGVMLDGANFNVLDGIDVHNIGHEGVHFRTQSSDNIIQNSEIYDTGKKKEKFGEGVYLGSAVSNWKRYTDGEPDQSDRNNVLNNHIWNTASENIDIKEGTEGGLIEGNTLDGSQMSGADSWVDLKGNKYTVRGNSGANSPKDGFQTHVINNMSWGRENVFDSNIAEVNGDGFGFYIHDPDTSDNTVRCNNQVTGAESGFANVDCSS
jgi:hypothetical protein